MNSSERRAANARPTKPSVSIGRRFASGVVRLIVGLYFLFGVAVLGARWFATTQIETLRPEIAAYLSKASGIHIEADRINVGFRWIWPVLRLENARLARPDGPVSLEIPSVVAELGWSSVLALEPRFNRFVVSDPHFTVRRLSESAFDIGGFLVDLERLPDSEKDSAPASFAAAAWLLNQNELILKRGRFTYIDERPGARTELSVRNAEFYFRQGLVDRSAAVEATVVQPSGHHRLVVRARLEKGLFTVDTDPLTWKGEVYADLGKLNAGLLMQRIGFGNYLQSGRGAGRLWASFDAGRITSAQADLALFNVQARAAENLEPLVIRRLRGRFGYAETNDGRVDLFARNFAFETARHNRFGPTNLEARVQRDASGRVLEADFKAASLELGALGRLAPTFPLPEEVRSFLHEHMLSGSLRDFEAGFRGNPTEFDGWHFATTFYNLTLQPSGNDPILGFRNLSGAVRTLGNGDFELDLDAPISTLVFPDVFRHPRLTFDHLKGRARLSMKPRLALHFENFLVENKDAAVTASGFWEATGGAGTINIRGEILRANGPSVPKYLPRVVGEGTLDYLEPALLGGRVVRGSWEVRGPLEHFPWTGPNAGSGHFFIEGDIVDGRMDFLPASALDGAGAKRPGAHWPILEGAAAKLIFEGESMMITGSARSAGLTADNVHVTIPAFSADPVMLEISGRIRGDLSKGLAYTEASSMLSEILGGSLKDASGRGPMTADLHLAIPLTDPKKLRLNLRTTFADADFAYGERIPALTNATGEILITETGLSTKEPVAARSAEGLVTVGIATHEGLLSLDIRAEAGPTALKRLLADPRADTLLERLTGTTPVQVRTRIALTDEAAQKLGTDIVVEGVSTLEGLTSTYPLPLSKPAVEAWPTHFRYERSEARSHLLVDGRDRFGLDLGSTAGHPAELAEGILTIGTELPRKIPEGRLDVRVKEHYLSFDDWHPVLDAYLERTSGKTQNANGSAIKLGVVRIEIDELVADQRRFKQFDTTLRRIERGWHLRLKADTASGQVEILERPDGSAKSYAVKLTKLYVPELLHRKISDLVEHAPETGLGPMPDVNLVIDDLQVGPRHVGKVEFRASNDKTGVWRISRIAAANAGGTIAGTGFWTGGATPRTNISLDVNLSSLGTMLQEFDLKDAIRGMPLRGKVRLGWAGAPYAPDAATLSGQLALTGGEGQFLQVEPGAGRLLSLLSMQHLLRRLTLDFRDVLSKGFGFDTVYLEGRISEGLLRVEKSAVNGSSAAVLLAGDVDLVNNLLDLKATVLPSLNAEGASLALAIANPAIGIGTFIAQLVLKDHLSELLRSDYAIKGSFDDPAVEKLARKRTEFAPIEER